VAFSSHPRSPHHQASGSRGTKEGSPRPPASSPAARTLDDAGLRGALINRQPWALEEAYRRHSPAVFTVARRVLRDVTLAEEVVQEVFVRLWRQPDRFDPLRGTLRSYLLIDANARAIELVRSEVARRRREDRGSRLEAPVGCDVERDAWDLVLADHLLDALGSLSRSEREAIELAYYGGHTYQEVARLLGEPEGTVKSRIRSGLLRLRDRLVALDIGAPA